jgi:hypothetical protein
MAEKDRAKRNSRHQPGNVYCVGDHRTAGTGIRGQRDLQRPENLAPLVVRPTAMRQALLSALTAAIKLIPGGQVTMQTRQVGRDVCISIEPAPKRTLAPLPPPLEGGEGLTAEDLALARQLVTLSDGSLEVAASHGQGKLFVVKLLFPATERVGVLVVDDNVDTLQLLERYVAATRYHFIAAPDPQRAVVLAEEMAPQVIVLDVMLPGIDDLVSESPVSRTMRRCATAWAGKTGRRRRS